MIKKNKHEECKKWMKEVIELNTDLDIDLVDDDSQENIEYAEYILEALEKQIPKKPKFINGNVKVFCPKCASPLNGKDYCGDCGQKIDWSDDEYEAYQDEMGGIAEMIASEVE